MASMHTATALQDCDRCFLSADETGDSRLSLDQENGRDGELDQPLNVQSGVGLRVKTAGVRKGKRYPALEWINLVRTGACQTLNDRTALLMHHIVSRFALDKVCEEKRTQRAWNYRVFSATTGDMPISYIIKIYRNAEPPQLKMWAQEEYTYHSRILACGVNIPEPVLCLEHILVTRNVTIGVPPGCKVVPFLKEFRPNWKTGLRDGHVTILRAMRQLYQRARVMHGNLSEHTVLFQSV